MDRVINVPETKPFDRRNYAAKAAQIEALLQRECPLLQWSVARAPAAEIACGNGIFSIHWKAIVNGHLFQGIVSFREEDLMAYKNGLVPFIRFSALAPLAESMLKWKDERSELRRTDS